MITGREAHLENLRILDDYAPPKQTCTCTDLQKATSMHMCEGCLIPTICLELSDEISLNLKVCASCKKNLQTESAGVSVPKTLAKLPGLAARLNGRLRDDAKIVGWSGEKKSRIFQTILDGLIEKQAEFKGSEVVGWRDEYFTRLCPDTGERNLALSIGLVLTVF
jgi:hypothetical protein